MPEGNQRDASCACFPCNKCLCIGPSQTNTLVRDNGEVLGAEDGGSDDALTGEVEGTWRLAADSEDIPLGMRRVLW